MDGRAARILSERHGRWLLAAYPPLLFQRVRCVSIGPGFRSCRMRVAKSLVTRNLNGTTFGGTIFAAADPIYALLFWQIFAREGIGVQVWLKRAAIDYLKPAATVLTLDFAIPDPDVAAAREALETTGRWRRTYRTDAVDASGAVCATIDTEIYVRLPRGPQQQVSGF